MELWILNRDFERIYFIETFESLIWTDRYNEYGDFEVIAAMDEDLVSNVECGMYAYLHESEHMMIINDISVNSSAENGATFTLKGYSLESILSQRYIVDTKTIYKGSYQQTLRKLINECIISPSNPSRKIPNFIFSDSDNPDIVKIDMWTHDIFGENLYTFVKDTCREFSLGFKIIYDFDLKKFVFSLYKGSDRSYSQTKNAYVTFSPNYDNLLSSEYRYKVADTINTALVQGAPNHDLESSETSKKTTKSKTGSKSKSGSWTNTTETTTTTDFSSDGSQIKKVVETVQSSKYEVSNDPKTIDNTTTTTKTYNHRDVLIETKVVVDNNTTTKVEQKSGDKVIKTTTDKTNTHSEKTDNSTETTENKKVTTTHSVADGDGFVTSETETVLVEVDTKTTKGAPMYIYDTHPSITGLDRFETYIDATSIPTKDEKTNKPIGHDLYEQSLKAKGELEIDKNRPEENYTGETDPTAIYILGEDYFIGDIVQVENEYGKQSRSEIGEIIYSQSTDKTTILPTFRKAPRA